MPLMGVLRKYVASEGHVRCHHYHVSFNRPRGCSDPALPLVFAPHGSSQEPVHYGDNASCFSDWKSRVPEMPSVSGKPPVCISGPICYPLSPVCSSLDVLATHTHTQVPLPECPSLHQPAPWDGGLTWMPLGGPPPLARADTSDLHSVPQTHALGSGVLVRGCLQWGGGKP